jgi:hypothetical protein
LHTFYWEQTVVVGIVEFFHYVALSTVIIKPICLEEYARNGMWTGQTGQLLVPTAALFLLKVHCEPVIPVFHFILILPITYGMTNTR